jgi:hypothetical protein
MMSDLQTVRLNIAAIASVPRLGFQAHFGCAHSALGSLGIPIHWGQGAFYGQTMQRLMEKVLALETAPDVFLTLDYDTLFSRRHVDQLIYDFASHPEYHALAALQIKRQSNLALLHTGSADGRAQVKNGFSVCKSAHFGLTLIRADLVRALPKPWFAASANEAGEWGDGRVDEDIWFWRRWEAAGHTLAVDCNVRVGHVEEMTRIMDENYDVEVISVAEWKEREDALAQSASLHVVKASE